MILRSRLDAREIGRPLNPLSSGGLAEVVRSPTFSTAVGLVPYGMSRTTVAVTGEPAMMRSGLFGRLRRTLTNVF